MPAELETKSDPPSSPKFRVNEPDTFCFYELRDTPISFPDEQEGEPRYSEQRFTRSRITLYDTAETDSTGKRIASAKGRITRTELNRDFRLWNCYNGINHSRFFFVCTKWPCLLFFFFTFSISIAIPSILAQMTFTTFMDMDKQGYYDSFLDTEATFVKTECRLSDVPYTTTSYTLNTTTLTSVTSPSLRNLRTKTRTTPSVYTPSYANTYTPSRETPTYYTIISYWRYSPEPHFFHPTRQGSTTIESVLNVINTPPVAAECKAAAESYMNDLLTKSGGTFPIVIDGVYNYRCVQGVHKDSRGNMCFNFDIPDYNEVGFYILGVVICILGAIGLCMCCDISCTGPPLCGCIYYVNSVYIIDDETPQTIIKSDTKNVPEIV